MKKFKLISLLATFALCLCTLGIGVWAARQASFNSSGTITFNAVNVEATVSGVVKNAKKVGSVTPTPNATNETAVDLPSLTFDSESESTGTPGTTESGLTSWSNDLEFNGNGDTIELTIVVTNISETRDLWVYVEDIADPVQNLKREVEGDQARCILKGGENSTTFNITISVYNIYAGLGASPEYNFKIDLYDPGVIKSAEDTQIEYVKIENTQTAKAIGFKATATDKTKIDIQPLINIGGTVCVVTEIEGRNIRVEEFEDDMYGTVRILAGDYAFDLNNLSVADKRIVIPQTIKTMGSFAFNASDTFEFVIPRSVTSVKKNSIASFKTVTWMGSPEFVEDDTMGALHASGVGSFYFYDEILALDVVTWYGHIRGATPIIANILYIPSCFVEDLFSLLPDDHPYGTCWHDTINSDGYWVWDDTME